MLSAGEALSNPFSLDSSRSLFHNIELMGLYSKLGILSTALPLYLGEVFWAAFAGFRLGPRLAEVALLAAAAEKSGVAGEAEDVLYRIGFTNAYGVHDIINKGIQWC